MREGAGRTSRAGALLGACLVVAGCQGIGPASVGAGRSAYNDVIARTSSEQMLGMIVRMRYADPIGLLVVGSVTSSLRFGAKAGGEAGIGSESGYAGNLVPFSAELAYEDSPTISYVPIDQQAFLVKWLEPLSLPTVMRAMGVMERGSVVLDLLVARLNGLRSGPQASPAQRALFDRAALLLDALVASDVADWVETPARPGHYELVLAHYAPTHTSQVEEFLALTGAAGDARAGRPIHVPVEQRALGDDFHGLAFRTRSIGEILRNASQAIEVPEAHVRAGVVAATAPVLGTDVPRVRIQSSSKAPEHASLAVPHRGWWYYIDDTDLPSKFLFQQIQMLFLSQLFSAQAGENAPRLTIPLR